MLGIHRQYTKDNVMGGRIYELYHAVLFAFLKHI